jgi:hypothetical protein
LDFVVVDGENPSLFVTMDASESQGAPSSSIVAYHWDAGDGWTIDPEFFSDLPSDSHIVEITASDMKKLLYNVEVLRKKRGQVRPSEDDVEGFNPQ